MPRHNNFSNSEMRDMVRVYVQENCCGRRARRTYLRLYPNRALPNHQTFKNIYDRLGESGEFRPKSHIGRPKRITADQEDEILVRIAEDPELSTRRLSAITGVSKSSIFRILHKEDLRPFHFIPVQNLLPRDLPARVEFSQFLQNKQTINRNFIENVLFTDEATFTRRGVFNWRNSHYWDVENQHTPRESHFQQEFKINVWCGIRGDQLLGPYELPPNLNGASYLNFLQTELYDEMNTWPRNIRQNLWFMQDGAPPHYSLEVRNYLNLQFPHRWIGRGSEFRWPARSPDFNPMDFYFWGHMKTLVYSQTINNRQELWQQIQNAAQFIRNQPAIFFKVRQSLTKRIRKCIDVGGAHFENLLK